MAPSVCEISRCTIKPKNIVEESKQPCYLTPWDLTVLSADYIQKGFIFDKPPSSIETVVDRLKDSLSLVLTHFYPLTGRLVTKREAEAEANPPSYSIFLSCDDPQGAEFVHATSELSVSDITSPIDVPPLIINSLFALDKPMNHDGHTLPLLAIQITELVDGLFMGCSFNHVVGDGSSFWHFMSCWSETCRKNTECIISRPPITKRWFLDGQNRLLNLPFSHQDEFIIRYLPPFLREKIFHVSAESIAQLKTKANSDCNTRNISSFQALAAHIWRSITRARNQPKDQMTMCHSAIDDRPRIDPPISKDYFGNCIQAINGITTTGELLENSLGWAAMMLHQVIAGYNNLRIRATLEALMKAPFVYNYPSLVNNTSVMFGSSPRFDVYGNDFGWGKPVGIRSGYGNKFEGKVTLYPGRKLDGSVDVELCLAPETMKSLELDEEFMSTVS